MHTTDITANDDEKNYITLGYLQLVTFVSTEASEVLFLEPLTDCSLVIKFKLTLVFNELS